MTMHLWDYRGHWLLYPGEDVDNSDAPIYLLKQRPASDQETRAEFMRKRAAEIQWWKEVNHPVATITDLRYMEGDSTAYSREMFAEYLEKVIPYMSEHVVASATIATTAEHRRILTAFRWVVGNELATAIPSKEFDNIDDAKVWCRKKLRLAGVSYTDGRPYWRKAG